MLGRRHADTHDQRRVREAATLGRPIDRRLTTAALLATCAILSLWVAFTVERRPVDFSVYYMAGALAHGGHSFYTISDSAWTRTAHDLAIDRFTRPYRYPPYTAALMSPFAPLGYFRAMVGWQIAGAAALIAGAVLLGHALGGGRRIALTLVVLACFGPVYHGLYDGQVVGLVFLALAVSFWGLARGHDLPAGMGVAVAAALKLTPLALLAYFAWRRRWRAFLIGCATLVALTVLTLPVTGPSVYGQYAVRAYGLTGPERVNPSGANQSATAVLARVLLPSAAPVAAGSSEGSRAVVWLARVFAVVLVVATVWLTRPRARATRDPAPRETGSGDDLLGFGMVVAASLVIGPFTWYHQFTWLLIPFMTVACMALTTRKRWIVALLGALLVAVAANELLWQLGSSLVVPTGLYRELSAPFAAALLLWASAAVTIHRRRIGPQREQRGRERQSRGWSHERRGRAGGRGSPRAVAPPLPTVRSCARPSASLVRDQE